MLFKICRKIALILTSLMVVQTEATLELRMFERADCLSTSWNTTKVIENLCSNIACAAQCHSEMHCSAVKYNESSKLCELGNIEKLDCRADKVSSNLTTTLFKVVKNGQSKKNDESKGVLISVNCWTGNPIQAIDLDQSQNYSLKMTDFPFFVTQSRAVSSPSGIPVICGGAYPDTKLCYMLTQYGWELHSAMNVKRSQFGFAYNSFSPDPVFVALGGSVTGADQIEFYHHQYGWKLSDLRLPSYICYSCARFINASTVINSGGSKDCVVPQVDNNSYFITPTSLVRGPSMKVKRADHGCALIKRNSTSSDNVYIIAGGYESSLNQLLSSVEIYDPVSNQWSDGVPLPYPMRSFGMTEDRFGGVLIVGGYTISNPDGVTTIWYLPHGGLDASWILLPQKLSYSHNANTASIVPRALGIF